MKSMEFCQNGDILGQLTAVLLPKDEDGDGDGTMKSVMW